ncbi:uncharacterized protein LOC125206674 [Salvia hispanica]|uniref:uncharacterized protein LOC125206674 n=1 Tax=Salvia hispanica TaxID=49212 RepID=UPI002009BDD1|nr:uncharacterized protein LOC125206674 [Salvia hispanica]
MKQGELTLEQLWHRLQNIWMSIDRRKPNPMKYAEDITIYNIERQETRLFQFLMALNDNYEATRKEILKMDPLSSVKNAYATVRREATNEGVLKPVKTQGNPADEGIGAGLAIRGGGRSGLTPQREDDRRYEDDKNKLVCTHCGGRKHTKEQCFLIVGYPDWWEEMKRKRANWNGNNRGGRGNGDHRNRAAGAANLAGSTGCSTAGRNEAGGSGSAAAQIGDEIASASVVKGYSDGDDCWAWH